MTTNKRRRYRCTAWPDARLPQPRAAFFRSTVDDDARLIFEPGVRMVELPDELVLRELQELPSLFSSEFPGQAYLDFLWSWGSIWQPFSIKEGWIASRPLMSLTPLEGPVKLADPALWLQTTRTLSTHWIAHKSGGSVSSVWNENQFGDGQFSDGPIDDDAAWHFWTLTMNVGLQKFGPRLLFQSSTMEDDEWSGDIPADLYEALSAQLFNIVVDDLPVRTYRERSLRQELRQAARARWSIPNEGRPLLLAYMRVGSERPRTSAQRPHR